MNDKPTSGSPAAWIPRSARLAVAVLMLALSGAGGDAQTPPAISAINQPGKQMKQFIFIFRQGNRLLSPEEQKQRADEVRAWALAQIKEGRKLDPRILGGECYRVTPDGGSAPTPPISDGSVIAITFLEARDFSEAVAIAKTHPGPRYGVAVEVREWSPPQPPAIPNPHKQ